MNHKLERIFKQFQSVAEFVSFEELNAGHINDTFLIKTAQSSNYVLQKLNGAVFKDGGKLIENKFLISKHLQRKFAQLSFSEIQRRVLCFVASKSGNFFYQDIEGNYWNLSVFIADSVTYEKTPNSEIAYEAGKATGNFLALTSDFNAAKLTPVLPDFHSVSKRFLQFKEALKNASKERKEQAKELIDFSNSNIAEMLVLDDAIRLKKLPLRVTHNDTKISNILFSKNNKALCLIDTDTVMEGVIHFDYGDAIRTICNTSDEDCSKTHQIGFNMDYFKRYTTGFLQELKDSITSEELQYLSVSIQIMPFIMGLRFLTDFLNNDVYYKTNYEQHNFDRSKNQYTLVQKIKEKYSEIDAFIESAF
ncbi:MAG: aminoglycoside phosphotransferase family protein [Polaribacter sp.]|nr:aminoglycoside phosphotransferase family protein [Polaribacter sp.]